MSEPTSSEPSPRERLPGAARPRRRAPGGVVAALAFAGVAAIVGAAWSLSSGVRPSDDGRLGAGAAVTRGGARLARIDRVSRSRPRRLRVYQAPAAGPVIDSARVGVLAAWLLPGTAARGEPVIALVPRDSVAGFALVARLAVVPGEPGLLVFEAPASRP